MALGDSHKAALMQAMDVRSRSIWALRITSSGPTSCLAYFPAGPLCPGFPGQDMSRELRAGHPSNPDATEDKGASTL